MTDKTDSKERAGRTADPLRAAKEDVLRAIEAQPDDGWRVLFAQVACILKCLPSSFLDGNAHVLRQAKLMADQYRAPEECQQCFGSGEVVEHAEDCTDDHCALNGDEHSCIGVVRTCSCQAATAPDSVSLAASAGSEPVAAIHWPIGGPPRLMWHSNAALHAAIRKAHEGHQSDVPLYLHPSPPEGMVGGLQVYRCKIKSRKQIDREIPRELQGWWADVAAGQKLLLRQAVQSDLDRCNLGGKRSRNPADYMCETHTNGSLVSKVALEYMNPEENVFAAPPTTSAGSGKGE